MFNSLRKGKKHDATVKHRAEQYWDWHLFYGINLSVPHQGNENFTTGQKIISTRIWVTCQSKIGRRRPGPSQSTWLHSAITKREFL